MQNTLKILELSKEFPSAQITVILIQTTNNVMCHFINLHPHPQIHHFLHTPHASLAHIFLQWTTIIRRLSHSLYRAMRSRVQIPQKCPERMLKVFLAMQIFLIAHRTQMMTATTTTTAITFTNNLAHEIANQLTKLIWLLCANRWIDALPLIVRMCYTLRRTAKASLVVVSLIIITITIAAIAVAVVAVKIYSTFTMVM